MTRVQSAPISIAVAGAVVGSVLLVIAAPSLETAVLGCLALVVYLAISSVLVVRGLLTRGAARFGPANVVTAVRSSLVGVCAALVVASFIAPVSLVTLVALAVIALLLDGVDGWVARRTNTSSELGARFDMEVDAFLLLVLSVYVSRELGSWVLVIGLMRYAFVAAGWVLPWLNRQLPYRYWRKVVTAVQGIALTIALTGLIPGAAAVLVALALGLLVESFGRDVLWLVVRRGADSAGLSTPHRPDSGGFASTRHENRSGRQHGDAHGLDHERLRNEGEAPRLRNAE